MPVSSFKLLISDLIPKIGDRRFYTIDDLYLSGFFGSKHAARMALKNGRIAYVKVSPRRRVIPHTALVEYLKNNLSEVAIQNEPSDNPQEIFNPRK